MTGSGYYPAGAEHDPNAPYNEQIFEDMKFDVEVSQVLVKHTDITTNDYDKGYDDERREVIIDKENIDWAREYKSEHMTPLELINEFKRHLTNELQVMKSVVNEKRYAYLIEECSNWEEEDFDAYGG